MAAKNNMNPNSTPAKSIRGSLMLLVRRRSEDIGVMTPRYRIPRVLNFAETVPCYQQFRPKVEDNETPVCGILL